MRITDLLTKDTINLSLESTSKANVIHELVEVLDRAGKLTNSDEFKKAILAREAQSTTGIGEGIAIPHAKTNAVKESAIAFGRSNAGINYESLDGQPAHLFFMIAAKEDANNTHLQVLSRLSTILMNKEIRNQLLTADSVDEVLEIINQNDVDNDNESDEESVPQQSAEDKTFIVAVTACPTGIAHTYMAADSLKAKAEELGVEIKVETNGASGVKNRLTPEDIERAEAVIVAADKQVEMNRFNGKHVIETAVADGIRIPEKLIEKAVKQDAPIYHADKNETKESEETEQRGIGATIYKHLMNGVSNMLPFVVGGGILIALGFLFGVNSADPNDPSYNEFAAALNTIGGQAAFGLMIAVLAGFIASSIADRPGFAPGMVGGMLATIGEAGFLGGLVAGFLAGYLMIGLKKILSKLPASIEGIKTILLYPLLGIGLTGLIMVFVVNTPVGLLNKAITEWLTGLGTGNAVLLGIVLGLMMAVDMGGPVNKAAYVFGTGLIASGVYAPMAAIMAAGMVPPLAVAIATTFYKNKFSPQERDAGKVNYIMGLSFITEGAIPFAAADPLRVIPTLMLGSAIAGGLSMFFDIGLRAPHGGIFVFPLVDGNVLFYLLSVIIGAVVSGLLLGFMKKPIQ